MTVRLSNATWHRVEGSWSATLARAEEECRIRRLSFPRYGWTIQPNVQRHGYDCWSTTERIDWRAENAANAKNQ